MLLSPPATRHPLTATVALEDRTLSATYPERYEPFIEVCKAQHCGFEYPAWVRTIGGLAGEPAHRAADLVRALLSAGFRVATTDELADLAQSGVYPPECRRWVLAGRGEFDGWLRFWWGRGEPDFYQRATFIAGSRYDRNDHAVCVPAEMYAEVVDFAAMHAFRVHPKAQALIDAVQRRAESAVVIALPDDAPDPTPEWRRPRLDAGSVTVPDRLRDFTSPPAFRTTTTLLPHQIPAVEHVAPLTVGALFMDMGTGKTRCAIELAARRQARISRVVWFCPVSLKATAVHEIRKHTDTTPDQIYVFDEATTTRDLPQATWYVVGTESISGSDRVTLSANSLIDDHTLVVVDESSYLKGHAAKRTRRITQMARRAAYRLILTGTPLSQGVEDLYAQMRFLAPEILGYNSFYSFAANHLEYHPDYPGMIVRAHNTDHLAAKIAPYVYQVTKDEAGLNLPAKLYESRYCDLTPEQAEWYAYAKDTILEAALDDVLDSVVIFQLFGALQQIASGFWHRGDELIELSHNRLKALDAALLDVPEGEPVIVWCKYVYSVRAIAAHLQEQHGAGCVACYYGDLDEHERAAELARWRAQADGTSARFLVATLATGGHGLTLTESAYAVFYENGFKYSERIQAEDRIHRIGQERRPTYIDLYAACGIEERIERAISRKEDIVQAFRRDVGRAKDRITEAL